MNEFTVRNALKNALLTLLLLTSAQFSSATEIVTYYVNDALGSPIMALDEAGAVVWQESYQPYGQRQIKSTASQADEQFYTGKQEEPDIGLQYYGARWYDPDTGRFTSIDPVGVDEGNIHSFNRYAYANNNPYKYVDPNGESPLDIAFFAVDALAFGVAVASGNPAAMGSAGLDLTMSAIGLVSPIPGTGQVLKFARVADKFGDSVKVANSTPLLLSSPRQHLLDSVTDPKLSNRIDKLYRVNAKVGNGSTADAIRHELKTGEMLSPSGHFQKGIEMRNGLMKDIKSGRLNDADTSIARGLVKDLQNALSGQ